MVGAGWVGRVRLAYDRARMGAATTVLDTGSEVDLGELGSKVEEISDSLERFQAVKSKCTTIRKNADDIEKGLNAIADGVNGHLHEVRAELSKAEG